MEFVCSFLHFQRPKKQDKYVCINNEFEKHRHVKTSDIM